MPDPEQHESVNTDGGSSRSTSTPRWAVAVPAVTFIVGLLLGGVVIGAGMGGGDSPESDAGPTTPGAGPTPTSDVNVVVPNACLEAAATVNEAMDLIQDGVGAVRDFRPEELVEMLNQLELLDARARDLAQQCSQVDVSRSP